MFFYLSQLKCFCFYLICRQVKYLLNLSCPSKVHDHYCEIQINVDVDVIINCFESCYVSEMISVDARIFGLISYLEHGK